VVVRRLLAGLIIGTQGASISWAEVGRLFVLLFLPFCWASAARPLMLPVIERWPSSPRSSTRAPYCSPSTAPSRLPWWSGSGNACRPAQIGIWWGLPAAAGLVLTSAYAIGRLGRFDRGSRAAILFCGSVKAWQRRTRWRASCFPARPQRSCWCRSCSTTRSADRVREHRRRLKRARMGRHPAQAGVSAR
jgi:predicted Na+-dependent transporter